MRGHPLFNRSHAYQHVNDHFQLERYGTTVGKEAMAGLTTFFSMAYMLFLVPDILSQSGMEWGAVFLATVIASVVGTWVMAFVANVPFTLAPSPSLASFFAFTACATMGFTWQQTLAVVFICGLVNILITVTNVRKMIVTAVPRSLQYAISGGIGLFVAYLGLVQSGFVEFGANPQIASTFTPGLAVFLFSLVLVIVLDVTKVRGSILISIIVSSAVAALVGVTEIGDAVRLTDAIGQLPETFGAIFTSEGIPSLFGSAGMALSSFTLILMFSFVDTFDTIGTFMSAGRQSGIFTEEEMETVGKSRFRTRLDRALVADSVATSVGAVIGTSNTTTVVESLTGIASGGRTGMTSLFTGLFIGACVFITPLVSMIPTEALAGVLILIGVMMMSSFRNIDWGDITEAIPAFFASGFMAMCYNISYGIGAGFIAYCLIKVLKGEHRDVHPIIWVASGVFLLAMTMMMFV